MTTLTIQRDIERWTYICRYADLVPGLGVAALVGDEQVAVFRIRGGALFAVGNYDPHGGAYVMSRGIVGSRGGVPAVASPMHKEVYDLRTGRRLDLDDELRLPVYAVYRRQGLVFCETPPPSSPAFPSSDQGEPR